jgi:hypothetical protein
MAIGQDAKYWPKEIPAEKGATITFYQPTLEELNGNVLTGRAAVSHRKSDKDEPVFGVIWFKAVLETDKDSRMGSLQNFDITKSKFSTEATQQQLDSLAAKIEREVMKWDLDISIDQILTNLESNKTLNDPYLKNDPPEIIYRNKPSTLVIIDGDPIVKMDEKMKMERVVNSSFLIVKEEGKFYTYASGLWFESNEVLSGHKHTGKLPSKIEPLYQEILKSEKENNNGKEIERPTTPPEVIVRTKPAELLQTDGEPKYEAIAGTGLLYATNTLDEIFKDVESQRTFVLLSGRWFSATSIKGPWTYVPADKLPADFAKIPRGSEKDGVLANVAGTPEAEEAKVDAQIPQTAKVDRKTAKIDVQFDGSPKFTAIENTSLKVAENSNVTVLQAANGKYYACENGVWFVSSSPTGPYTVSDERPADVEKIPPDNSAYNTKYVYIYETSPQYVYVGYTPGYMCTYVYGPTVVYGTGYYYAPWYGYYYYPRPVTYGFGFHYNPWTGWSMSFGMSYNTGWYAYGGVHVSIHFGGYWGGYGHYHYPPCHGWGYHGGYYGHHRTINNPTINVNRPVTINTGDINVGGGRGSNIYKDKPGVSTRDIQRNPDRGSTPGKGGARPSQQPAGRPSGGNASTRPSAGTQPAGGTSRPAAPVSGNKQNDVFAGKDGQVYQRDNQGNVQQRNNNQWQPASNQQSKPSVNQSQQQRDRSQMRDQNFSQQRPQQSNSRPSGGGGGARPSGGGGGRNGGRR